RLAHDPGRSLRLHGAALPVLRGLRAIAARTAPAEQLGDERRDLGRNARHRHADRLERGDLLGRRTRAARDDGARVAHALAGGCRLPGDDGAAGLADVALDELRRLFLVAAADLAHQHDRFGLAVGLEQRERVDEVGADHRIAADAETGRLAEIAVAEL